MNIEKTEICLTCDRPLDGLVRNRGEEIEFAKQKAGT